VAGQSLPTVVITCCCWPRARAPDDGPKETWHNPLLDADPIGPSGAFCNRASMALQKYRCSHMGQSVCTLKPSGLTVSPDIGAGAGERVAEG